MNSTYKDRSIAITSTVILHLLLLLILWITVLDKEIPISGSGDGVLVQIGFLDEPMATGEARPQQPREVIPEPVPEKIITQEIEETAFIEKEEKENPEPEAVEEEEKPAPPQPDPGISDKISNAFGKAFASAENEPAVKNGAGEVAQGSQEGNSSSGEIIGVGGYGGYNLGGRNLLGTLPRPSYDTSNDAGVICVEIVVNAKGLVIQAISTPKGSSGTAYTNPNLRQSAEKAARQAVFEANKENNNQTGYIYYHFNQNTGW